MPNLLMLEVGGMGMTREIRFNIDYIRDSRRAVILIDELNNVFWIWIGTMSIQKTRIQAPLTAEKLQQKGYNIENENIGKNCQHIIIIDQRHLEDHPAVAENHQKLLSIFNLPMMKKGKYLIKIESKAQVPLIQRITPKDKAIAGMLIVSVLDKYPDILIGRNSKGEYAIEAEMPLFKFKVINGTIQLLPGSPNIDQNIQEIFSELLNLL